MLSALVPSQPGDKVVNYPTRPVDTTTDFEGTTSLQSPQPVCANDLELANCNTSLKIHEVEISFHLPLNVDNDNNCSQRYSLVLVQCNTTILF